VELLYRDREKAKVLLEQAKINYRIVEAAADSDQLLEKRAWFGLAQIHESLADLVKAKDYYEKIVISSADSALGKEAQRRIDALDNPAVEKWYNWFANVKPRPGMPGNPDLPADLGDLPDRPDISLPQPFGPPAATAEASDEREGDESATPASPTGEGEASAPKTSPATEGPVVPAKVKSPAPEPKKPDAGEATSKTGEPAAEKPVDNPPAEEPANEGEA